MGGWLCVSRFVPTASNSFYEQRGFKPAGTAGMVGGMDKADFREGAQTRYEGRRGCRTEATACPGLGGREPTSR